MAYIVPSKRVNALRKTFESAMEDPELRTQAARLGLKLRAVSDERVQDAVRAITSGDRGARLCA